MCSEVFLDINFTSSQVLLFFHIVWHWLPSYFSYVSDGIWETNNYLTTFRIYLPFCTFGRSKFISGIRAIVSPDFDIQNFRNVTSSGVHAPYEVHAPPTGNPRSATEDELLCLHGIHFIFCIVYQIYWEKMFYYLVFRMKDLTWY